MRNRHLDDRGSLPLALLVIIALSGVIGALVATVIGSTRQTRFDQQYTEVVQAADTGAQAAAALLIRSTSVQMKQDAPVGTVLCGTTTAAACPATGVTTDGIPFEWRATKISTLGWEVRSTATTPEAQRTVVIEVADKPRFFLAAFSDRGFEMRGGNGADSYGSTAWYTGNGIVASNETIRLNGSSTGVDAVHLYNWDNNSDINRCIHVGGNDCDDVRTMPDATLPSARIGPKLQIGGTQLETRFIDEQLAACPQPLTEYKTSDYNGGNGQLGTAGQHTVLCFDNFTANRNITVNGTVEVYIAGDLLFGTPPNNDVKVNCPSGCAAGTSTPDARRLSFYVDGSGDPANPSTVKFGNHSAIAAGIYAPESSCAGNPSNAQASVFGSLICGTISNQGGWTFHYDDRLTEMGLGQYAQRDWREE